MFLAVCWFLSHQLFHQAVHSPSFYSGSSSLLTWGCSRLRCCLNGLSSLVTHPPSLFLPDPWEKEIVSLKLASSAVSSCTTSAKLCIHPSHGDLQLLAYLGLWQLTHCQACHHPSYPHFIKEERREQAVSHLASLQWMGSILSLGLGMVASSVPWFVFTQSVSATSSSSTCDCAQVWLPPVHPWWLRYYCGSSMHACFTLPPPLSFSGWVRLAIAEGSGLWRWWYTVPVGTVTKKAQSLYIFLPTPYIGVLRW